jgi:acetolactate synthase I/II/III large subunit
MSGERRRILVALDTAERIATVEERTTRTITGGALACEALLAAGVTTLFGYPGGAALPFYRELARYPALHHVLVRHEQNAAHAADGYARATGQVARAAIGTQAFQEVDIVGMVGPITKGAFQLKSADEIPSVFARAFRLAMEGRPGPVLIDFPKDIQLAAVDVDGELADLLPPPTGPVLNGAAGFALNEAAALLNAAERPVLIVGHGVTMAGAAAELLRLAEASGAPVGTTLLGLGVFPEQHPQALGMVGMHGTVVANLAMHHADLIVGIGMRFDDRVVGRPLDFAPNASIVHVDIDPQAFGRVVRADVAVQADARVALSELARLSTWRDRSGWWARLRQWSDAHATCGVVDPETALPEGAPTTPEVVRTLCRVMGGAATLVSDIGQHQMFVALHHGFDRPGQLLTSGGLGTMGYGLPAAMGVQIARPDALVIDIAGEASILMNIQEMSTLCQYRLPVKVFILNNEYMGMVRQWQELLHGGRYSESYTAALPDFVKLAEAFGAVGLRATKVSEVDGVIAEMLKTDKAVIADICVDKFENCFPMIPSGAAHNEMLLGPADKAGNAVSEEGMVLV